ncbi:helix-turn-helix domain-containing protein [Acidovorax citrulli]|nr:helix-turn-helix domain-containing protein [Paracidovorax citrulli]
MRLLGERLREERKRLGWSQVVAASHAGISREMWSKYEAGAEPGARVLAAVGAAGVDTQYVLTGEREGAGSPLTPEEQMLLSYFRDASKEVRKAALGALLGATVSSTAAPQKHDDEDVEQGRRRRTGGVRRRFREHEQKEVELTGLYRQIQAIKEKLLPKLINRGSGGSPGGQSGW